MKRTVLVPIIDGDVSEEALSVATALVSPSDSRLVLVHVTPVYENTTTYDARRERTAPEPRWRRLASAAPNRTFVEAVCGDPASEILREAERFDSDAIVVDALGPDDAVEQLLQAASQTVYVTNRRARPLRAPCEASPHGRSHAVQPHVHRASEQAAGR